MAVLSPRRENRATASTTSDHILLQSLIALSNDISSVKPFQHLLKSNTTSLIRKLTLLNHILLSLSPPFPSPALLCFDEMHVLLHRIKKLLQNSSSGSIIWLLADVHVVADTLRKLAVELSTLLDVFPFDDVIEFENDDVIEFENDDVLDVVKLVRNQCCNIDASLCHSDEELWRKLVNMLDGIKCEIVPDLHELGFLMIMLGLNDAGLCAEEIEKLEDEFRTQVEEKRKSQIVELIGFVRYAKCVLFGPGNKKGIELTKGLHHRQVSSMEVSFPTDFRCPISLELMRDPVVVSTGQTYDRSSINLWFQSGNNMCPKTGQTLAHTELIPNLALKNLIALWCREQGILFQNKAADGNERVRCVVTSKTALEVMRMTVWFLVTKLAVSQSVDDVSGLVQELRALAKSDSDSRACIADAGGIPLLVRYLGSGNYPNLQVNAVTTILNLSILEVNKVKIVETEGALKGVTYVLRFGASWEAKGNAAATIFSLSTIQSYRKRLGRKSRLIKGLLDLARDGPIGPKRDALFAVSNLAGNTESVGKFIDGGVVSVLMEVMNALPEEALTILEMVVKRGGIAAIASTYNVIRKLGVMLREGSDKSRESAAATLVNICRKGGVDVVAELAGISGIERVIWELMGSGTVRARRKSASLLRILRRWAAGIDLDHGMRALSDSSNTRNLTSTSRILLPS